MTNDNDSRDVVVCELCEEQLNPHTYVVGGKPVEIIFMHNDLTGARCKRIQKENNKKAKSK